MKNQINIILKSISEATNIEFFEKYENTYCSFENEIFTLQWQTGKYSGGDCFGGVASYKEAKYTIPDFNLIEEFFLLLDENFTLKSYLEFKNIITEKEINTPIDYYNNSTHFGTKSFNASDFLNIIENAKLNEKFQNDFEFLDLYFQDKVHQKERNETQKKENLLKKAYKIR